MIDTKLIEKALALTGNTMEYMSEIGIYEDSFSIEKFCYYLLSPEFIEKYEVHVERGVPNKLYRKWIAQKFWQVIYEYQKWDEELLTDLLSKI